MPIALYAAPRVEKMLQTKFGEAQFVNLGRLPGAEQDKILVENSKKAIVQLDVMSNDTDKGSLPGLHWLEVLLGQKSHLDETPIILTAWDPFIFAPGSKIRLRTRLGAQPKTALLESPLLEFIPLATLLKCQNEKVLGAAFPSIELDEGEGRNRFLHDIRENCYKQAGVSSFCHRLRQMFGEYWKKEKLKSGAALVDRFQTDIYTMINSVAKNRDDSSSTREARAKVEQHLDQLKAASSLTDSLDCFARLEHELIALDQREDNWQRPPLGAEIIMITKDIVFAKKFVDQLLKWSVNAVIVADGKAALELLKTEPATYSCVLSDFRIHEPEGKLSLQQGYEYLRQISAYDKGLKLAFLTSLYGARWEQPPEQPWLLFEKNELENLQSKAAEALYVFLKGAQEQYQLRFHKIPNYLLRNRSVFLGIEGYASEVFDHLGKCLEAAIQLVKDFGEGKKNSLNWPLAANSKTGARDFICECAFRRLVMLAMIRHQKYDDLPRTTSYKERLREVIAYVTSIDYDNTREITRQRNNCRDFLRLGLGVQYHDMPLSELQQKDLLFPFEVVLLKAIAEKT